MEWGSAAFPIEYKVILVLIGALFDELLEKCRYGLRHGNAPLRAPLGSFETVSLFPGMLDINVIVVDILDEKAVYQ
jgi:hypothetical protein